MCTSPALEEGDLPLAQMAARWELDADALSGGGIISVSHSIVFEALPALGSARSEESYLVSELGPLVLNYPPPTHTPRGFLTSQGGWRKALKGFALPFPL